MAYTLLIGYDLNRPGQNYEDLWAFLKTHGTRWHHLDSTWLVKSDITAKEMRDAIKPYLIDDNDELLVVDVTGDAAAWAGFDAAGSKWLKDNL